MNIQIVEQQEELKVIINCIKVDEEVKHLKNHIEQFDNRLIAKKNGEVCLINVSEVLYFESVDNRTFLYTYEEVLEIKQRLYELEKILSDKDFIRISKSQIANINQMKALRPELNRTILATMCNGEQLTISRKYVHIVRKLLGI